MFPAFPDVHPKRSGQTSFGAGFVLCAVLFGVVLCYPLALWRGPGGTGGFSARTLAKLLLPFTLELCGVLYGLRMVLYGEPGVVDRSADTCFPLPPQVEAWVAAGAPDDLGLARLHTNIVDGDHSYCVRCFVWRGPEDCTPTYSGECGGIFAGRPCVMASCRCLLWCLLPCLFGAATFKPTHHCSTCQRCVKGFDHHCLFYGRCITKYNMKYFTLTNGCGYLAFANGTIIVLSSFFYNVGK
jgi:hypothetical protein